MTDIPAGMVAYGPEHPDYPNEPRDWDGGEVYVDWGRNEYEMLTDEPHYLIWDHDPDPGDKQANIIAYTPRQPTPTADAGKPMGGDAEGRMREVLRDAYIAETGNSGTINAYWMQPVEQMEAGDRYALAAMRQYAADEVARERGRQAVILDARADRVDPPHKKRVPMVDQHTASVLRSAASAIRAGEAG